MKNRTIIIYSIFASLIFLFSIIFFSYNLYAEYANGQSRSARQYTAIINETKKLLEQNNISNIDLKNEYIYFYELKKNGNVIYSSNKDSQAKNNNSKLIRDYTTDFTLKQNDYSVFCKIYLLNPKSISYFAKISFLIILIITIITVILIIYNNIVSQTEQEVKEILKLPHIPEIKNQNEEQTVNQLNKDNITLPNSEIKPDNNFVSNENVFSQTTGFVKKEYFLPRLETEINKAISSEMEMSLFIIDLNLKKLSEQIIKKISEYLLIQFQFKDLIFECTENSIAALNLGMNIDTAIEFAKKLFVDINELINQKNKCAIGISSRSHRMVSAQRLFTEASQALTHAKEEKDECVIGFKIDAEKYLKFINNV